MALKIGQAFYLYRNTGSYGTPTWTLVNTVKDVSCTHKLDEVDASCRASNWKLTEPGMIEFSLETTILQDTENTQYQALLDAFNAQTNVEFLALDGPVATVGSEGPRAICKIFDFSRGEPLNDLSTNNVVAKPVYDATNPGVSWHVVSA